MLQAEIGVNRLAALDGERRSRPRLPKLTPGTDGRDDFYRMAGVDNIDFNSPVAVELFDGYDRFTAEAGQFEPKR